ncbi:MAG TPA: patatin-like phospholipase family protein [Longimicrobium sp.]|nr:patatin-like phospholipase family protein [Longimicrobium sp.]
MISPTKAPPLAQDRFHGPWELFEVLDREFRAIDPTFPERGSGLSPWRVEADDILNPREAASRIAELKLEGPEEEEQQRDPPGEVIQIVGVGFDTDGSHRAAAVLTAAMEREPATLVGLCARRLNDECGRALRGSIPDLEALVEGERREVRLRFNRQVLEAAFGGMLRPAGGREMRELLDRDRDHAATSDAATSIGTLPRGRWALCFSGGGIRSGTISLGILQGLARAGLLGRFDYLSTVSGGGYVGGWLSAWMHRQGRESVLEELARESDGPVRSEPTPVHHLRTYSNYMAPKQGLFSADTWTLGATVIRNLLLNWLVVLPALAAVLMIPIFCSLVVASPPTGSALFGWLAALAAMGFACASTGVWFVHSRRPGACHAAAKPAGEREAARARREALSPEAERGTDQAAFLGLCLVPIIAAMAFLSTAVAWIMGVTDPTAAAWITGATEESVASLSGTTKAITALSLWRHMIIFGALAHATGWLAAGGVRRRRWLGEFAVILASGALAGAISAVLLHVTTLASEAADRVLWLGGKYVVFNILASPGLLVALALAGFAFVGIASRWQNDEEREWSSRYSGWLLLTATGWLGLSTLVAAGAYLLDYSTPGLTLTGGTGLAAGAAAAKLGHSYSSAASKGKEAVEKGVKHLVQRYTLAVTSIAAVVLILVCLAALNWKLAEAAIPAVLALGGGDAGDAAWWFPALAVALLGGALLAAGSLAGRFIEGNRFSLHAMYRSRLIRAYLGASRPAGTRRPNPFTGFDPVDNVQMVDLAYPAEGEGAPLRPLHVVNMALNVTARSNLAWQERKARSFTVTALDAGACGLGYRRIRCEGDATEARYGGGDGVSLGTAMAISGAAASPNMGYHSSPPITFLMALFNARLGWWLGNPGWAGGKTFHHPSPRGAISPIFLDLLGLATDSAPVVYLSDGGHFENLGLYEMVLRRCAVIVVADGGCDEKFDFADLGNAVRKIRVDLGIPIEFPRDFPIGVDDGSHLVRGTIRYSAADPGAADGVLLYVKPALTGDEPRDVAAYARVSKQFPHESTADQFFSESQFESYRALGFHSARAVVVELADPREEPAVLLV